MLVHPSRSVRWVVILGDNYFSEPLPFDEFERSYKKILFINRPRPCIAITTKGVMGIVIRLPSLSRRALVQL